MRNTHTEDRSKPRTDSDNYRVLACASSHPDPVHPYMGLFNARSLSALAKYEADLSVVVPRPFAPPIGPYSEFYSIPKTVQCDRYGYTVHHPRYFYLLPKRLFYSLSGRSYANRIPMYLDKEFEEPDIVHAGHIYLDGYGVRPYCRDHRIPMTAMAHGWLLNNYDEWPGVQTQVDAALDECAHLLCVSDDLAAKARHIAPNTPQTVVPIGADPDRFRVDDAHQIRTRRGIDPDETLVLFCGQFIERKGIDLLLDAIDSLKVDSVRFVLIGHSGDLRDDAESLAMADDRVTVLSNVTNEELADWFAATDLLILPSRSEGRPTVIYEAMASETAVLATDVGGISEQIVDGTTGVLVPPDDETALERELSRLIENRALLRRFGQNGLKRLRQQGWTWRCHAERVAEIHRSVLKSYQK